MPVLPRIPVSRFEEELLHDSWWYFLVDCTYKICWRENNKKKIFHLYKNSWTNSTGKGKKSSTTWKILSEKKDSIPKVTSSIPCLTSIPKHPSKKKNNTTKKNRINLTSIQLKNKSKKLLRHTAPTKIEIVVCLEASMATSKRQSKVWRKRKKR